METKTGIGIKISPGSKRIPCLLFADDYLLFCKVETTACIRIKSLLDTFCPQSGQLFNYHKSMLTFSSNATSSHRQVAVGIFNITHSDSLSKYLGCPIFKNDQTQLVGWKVKCLSKAGRTVLIQSHLESFPAHTMQCFQLPSAVATNIDRVSGGFFLEKKN